MSFRKPSERHLFLYAVSILDKLNQYIINYFLNFINVYVFKLIILAAYILKKIFSISLAALLMVSTIGITVHKHYCENILVATSILSHGGEDACDTDMPMEEGACSDEHQHYDVDSPIVSLVLNFEIAPYFNWVAVSFFTVNTIQSEKLHTPKLYADVNPPPSEPNIYTKVQSFLL